MGQGFHSSPTPWAPLPVHIVVDPDCGQTFSGFGLATRMQSTDRPHCPGPIGTLRFLSGSLRTLHLLKPWICGSSNTSVGLLMGHTVDSPCPTSPLTCRVVEHFNEQVKGRFSQQMGGDMITPAWIAHLRTAVWGLRAAVPQWGTFH